MINIPLYLDYLIEHKLTQQQFLFLSLLRLNNKELVRKYKSAICSDGDKIIGDVLLDDLIHRGYVNWDGKTNTFKSYVLTDKFLDIFVDKYIAGNEIWNLYPSIVQSGGRTFPLSLMDKNEFRELYFNAINGSRLEHEEVMKDLTYGIEQSLIKGKIDMFVKSEFWLELRKLRLGTVKSITNVKSLDNEFTD